MNGDKAARVSILVHNRNRGDCLARCLESIATQRARPLEVVLLDAESTDDSPAIIARQTKALEALGIDVVFQSCAPAGVPRSRNLAASLATGSLLFFMDNDATLVGSDVVEELRQGFSQEPALGLVGCQIRAGDEDGPDPFCWVYRRPVSPWFNKPFDTFTFAGAGFCIRAKAYHACGGFWEVIEYAREEEALALRLLDQGWRVRYLPSAAVRHYPDPRGRRNPIERRVVELKNGVLIYWHSYPRGAGLLFSLLRVVSMSFRTVLRREGSIVTLLSGWHAARQCWREQQLRAEPVRWGTFFRLLNLHIPKGHAE